MRLQTLILIFTLVLTGQMKAQDTGSLKVGAAKVDITPEPSQLAFPTDTIRDRLYVRAIYIEDGSTSAVLASVAGGARNNVLEVALPKSSASTGCPIENYVVSGTHSHSTSTGGLGGRGFPTQETIADALVSAVDMAKANLAPARIGYGTTQLDLNVNRDHFNEYLEWRQSANWEGVSDKTLAVVEFLGEDDVPIAVYMNYGMHPVTFFQSGVISADFPGDASTYVEEMFDNNTIALFSQAPSGDQNPKMAYTSIYQEGPIKAVLPPHNVPAKGRLPSSRTPTAVPAEELAAHKKNNERKSDYVRMLGHMIGNSTLRTMLYHTELDSEASIWSGHQIVTVPGRERLDTSGRENYDPGYKDASDINLKVGLLRIGDINMVSVNGEVYTEIGQRLKAESPYSKTMMVTLANGSAGSGYIYSNNASYHQTFQVISSRLKPGYAEKGIVSAALDLMKQADAASR